MTGDHTIRVTFQANSVPRYNWGGFTFTAPGTFRYHSSGDYYQYDFGTSRHWAPGTCTLTVHLGDGTDRGVTITLQRRLSAGFAVVVGCGALGTVISAALVRAGVGRVRIIDRDFVEIRNLQRQVLFTEKDIADDLSKAEAAERHLREANTQVEVEGVVADFSRGNAEKVVAGADVIVDGLDNFETRFLINDVALKLEIPWVYGGAIGSAGMSATFLPGEPPCLRCLVRSAPGGGTLTCDMAGVVNSAPWITGSLQAAEALKVVIADPQTAPVSRAARRSTGVANTWELSRKGGCPTRI